MSFEDEVRATMRAHDGEAPTVVDTAAFEPTTVHATGLDTRGLDAAPQRRRTPRWLPVAAAALVVLAVGGLVLALRPGAGSTTPDGRLPSAACPAHYFTHSVHPWVPAEPTTPDPAARLVPRATPTSAVVCAYLGGDLSKREQPLTGARRLDTHLDQIAASLTWQPSLGSGSGLCAGVGHSYDGDDYLLRLGYGSRTLWVSAPAMDCSISGNGRFRTLNSVARYLGAAYRDRVWSIDPPALDGRPDTVTDEPCTAAGRLGQDKKMVPGSPTGLTVCVITSRAGASGGRVTDTDKIQAFAAALNALPTRPSDGDFIPAAGNKVSYRLAFTYAEGPGVQIDVHPGARPPLDNRSLQATELGPVLDLLRRATR